MKIDELERRKRYERYLPPKGEVKSEGQWSLECTSDRAPSEMVHPEARSCCEEPGDETKLGAEVTAATERAAAYQRAAAKKLGKPLEITNSIGMKLRLVPAGEFMMGSSKSSKEVVEMLDLGDNDDKYLSRYGKYLSREFPEHRVWITKPYYLGTTEVTQKVGRKRPNGFGLYDMHGNVFEWCSDWYDADYYANSPLKDPNGPASGQFRVVRGGAFPGTAFTCRSAFRNGQSPVARIVGHGFRVVLRFPEE